MPLHCPVRTRAWGNLVGIRTVIRGSAFGSLAVAAVMAGLAAAPAHAQPAALSGRVTSSREPAMEGVLVSAKREGSNKTVTVVTHADGRYSFPSDRLEPGRYAVSVRAVKYVLADRNQRVDIATAKPAQLDLELRDSNPLELALQLTDPE